MPLFNFTFSVDTFFLISGILLIHSNWKKLTLSKGRLDYIGFLVHRLWRIWPAYLATIGFSIVLPLLGSGPLWEESVQKTANICREKWWTNLLFINNLLDADKACLFHTWFLSASMQFHVIGGILLYIIFRLIS